MTMGVTVLHLAVGMLVLMDEIGAQQQLLRGQYVVRTALGRKPVIFAQHEYLRGYQVGDLQIMSRYHQRPVPLGQ